MGSSCVDCGIKHHWDAHRPWICDWCDTEVDLILGGPPKKIGAHKVCGDRCYIKASLVLFDQEDPQVAEETVDAMSDQEVALWMETAE